MSAFGSTASRAISFATTSVQTYQGRAVGRINILPAECGANHKICGKEIKNISEHQRHINIQAENMRKACSASQLGKITMAGIEARQLFSKLTNRSLPGFHVDNVTFCFDAEQHILSAETNAIRGRVLRRRAWSVILVPIKIMRFFSRYVIMSSAPSCRKNNASLTNNITVI
jgi:hypothetical protein